MSTLSMWGDNPLFVKHVRSRLRKGQFLAPAIVMGTVCAVIAYGCYEWNYIANGYLFGAMLSLQVLTLGLMGATQVSASVGGARESGILDFHRVSPLSPLAVTLGFFFGAPVREYVLASMTLPFVLYCAAEDAPSLGGAAQAEVVVLLSCWQLHAIALLTSLATKKPKAGTKGAMGAIGFLMIFAGPSGFYALSQVSTVLGTEPTLPFFGAELPWLADIVLCTVPVLFFFLLASVRKMRSERAHAYTKPEAVVALGVAAVLVLGAVWKLRDFAYLPLFVAYSMVGLAVILILTITPNLGEFAKGVRRAEREGKARLGPWHELALNRVAVLTLCGLVLVAPTVAWYVIAPGPFPPAWGGWPGMAPAPPVRSPSYSVSIAVAVLAVATFGLALQFFLLRAPRRGGTLLGLFVFLTWLIPPAIGAILGATNAAPELALAVVSLSPLAGIATSTDLGPMSQTGTDLTRLCALLPSLLFALLFNNGVTLARRRVIAAIHGASPAAKPEEVPDPLAA